MDALARTLGELAADDPDRPPVQRLYGVVDSVAPLLVRVGASLVPTSLPALASYAPTVGDFVTILRVGPDRLVLGKVGEPDVVSPAELAAEVAAINATVDALPRGIIARGTMPGIVGFASGVDVLTVVGTMSGVTILAGRRYRIVTFVRAVELVSGNLAAVTSYRNTVGGAQKPWGDSWHQSIAYYYGSLRSELFIEPASDEALNIQACVTTYTSAAGTLYADGSSLFYLEDVGAV